MRRRLSFSTLGLATAAWLIAAAGCVPPPAPSPTPAPTATATAAVSPEPALTPNISDFGPPPAELEIDGARQVAGIGTHCWSVEGGPGLCVDMLGIPTAPTPLAAEPALEARLTLPLAEPPDSLILHIFPVTAADEFDSQARGYRWWDYVDATLIKLPLERQQTVELNLRAGLHVLGVAAAWEAVGDVMYGFLVDVR